MSGTADNLAANIALMLRPPKGFADRSDELDELKTAISRHQSVVIHGPRGIGKTFLFLKAWEDLSSDFKDIIIPISAGKKEPQVLIGEIATQLGATIAERTPSKEKKMVLAKLLGSSRALIWLDDVETKQADGIASLRDALPDTCTLVLTSEQAALRQFFRPISLDTPSPDDAVEMFLSICGQDRAQYEHQKEDIMEVCDLVHYLPIAIDLIARRVVKSGVPVIHYVGKLRSRPQNTVVLGPVWDAFTLTYHELAPAEQKLFVFLGIFPGESFSLDAVEFLGNSLGFTGINDGVEKLNSLSLVKMSSPDVRLSLQPLLREFAESKIAELRLERAFLEKELAKYFLKYVLDKRWPHSKLDAEYGNVIGCIEWCKRNVKSLPGGTLISYIRDLLDVKIAEATWIVFLYARLLKRHGESDRAYEVYKICLETAEKERLLALKIACLRSLGEIELNYKKLPFKKQHYISEAIIDENMDSTDTEVIRETIYMINFLLEYRLERGPRGEEFKSLAMKSLALRDKISEPRAPGVSFAAARLVDFWILKKDFEEASNQLSAEGPNLDPHDRASRYCRIADAIVKDSNVEHCDQAMKMYEAALNNYKIDSNYGGCAWAERGMGEIRALQQRWDDASRFYEKALERRSLTRDGYEVAGALVDLARLWYRANEPEEGVKFWERAKQEEADFLPASEASKLLLAEAVSELAEVLVDKKSDRALEVLDKGEKLYVELANHGGRARISQLRGEYHIYLQNWLETQNYFDDAIYNRNQEGDKAKLRDTFHQIVYAYEKAGKAEIARKYRNKAVKYGLRSRAILVSPAQPAQSKSSKGKITYVCEGSPLPPTMDLPKERPGDDQRERAEEEGLEPAPASSGTMRDKIFVSYSHKDKRLFGELKTMLAPAVRTGIVDIWDDTKIPVGAKWRDEIQNALSSAKIAVLLVSPNFLASDFIAKNELPPLLEAAEKDGVKIVWIYLSSALYEQTPIRQYQAAHDIGRPLDRLSKPERQAVLSRICFDLSRMA